VRRDMDYDDVKTALAEWDGYRGLLYFHLRLRQLERAGYVNGGRVYHVNKTRKEKTPSR
jgi:hypothetical protein